MTKNEDILKPFEVIERQTLEVENFVEKNKYFKILFFSQLYTQLDTCQKFHPALLCRIKKYLPHQARQTFYHSFILPHMDYCSTLWGDSSAAERIHKLQKRAAIESLPDRVKYGKALLVFKSVKGLAPDYNYVRTFRVSTNGLIAKHTFKCQR